MKFIYRVGRNR